jgi:hypothetical protein
MNKTNQYYEIVTVYRGKETRQVAKSKWQADVLSSEALFGQDAKVTVRRITAKQYAAHIRSLV